MARITMLDVARAAGVSRALVSLAYRNAPGVSASTRARVLATGRALGYVPDRVAASLASRQVGPLGVFLQDLHNDVFAGLYDGIREIAESHDRELVLAIGDCSGARDATALMTLAGARVDVTIAAGLRLSDAEALEHASRTSIVSVARVIDGIDSVYSDNLHGARLATEHLLGLGHRSIVFLANPPSDGYYDRRIGYERSMRRAGLEPRVTPSTFARADAAADTVALLERGDAPTAIFAHNDQAALGVLDALVARGLRPGADLSVVGYDNSSIGSAPGTALTSVDLRAEALGAEATRMALWRSSEPDAPTRVTTSLPDLVVRGTTGPPSSR